MKITEQTTLEELSGLFPEAEGKLISGGDFFTAKRAYSRKTAERAAHLERQ